MLVLLFYQDFNEQFEGYTQPLLHVLASVAGCFIRISMNNLKDIAGIISYDIADYGMHLSRKQLFRQFLQQGKFDKQNENLPL